jgi:hypothetical protein
MSHGTSAEDQSPYAVARFVRRHGGGRLLDSVRVPLRARFVISRVDGVWVRHLARRYNGTWTNERAVEIPLARRFLKTVVGDGAEVGNVLGHYGIKLSTVVDKYDHAAGITNVDVVEWYPTRPLDYLVSISTIEHVGRDETPRRDTKAVDALSHLIAIMKPEGRLFITAALGHNPALDEVIASGAIQGARVREVFLGRPAGGGVVRQVEPVWPSPPYVYGANSARQVWVATVVATG